MKYLLPILFLCGLSSSYLAAQNVDLINTAIEKAVFETPTSGDPDPINASEFKTLMNLPAFQNIVHTESTKVLPYIFKENPNPDTDWSKLSGQSVARWKHLDERKAAIYRMLIEYGMPPAAPFESFVSVDREQSSVFSVAASHAGPKTIIAMLEGLPNEDERRSALKKHGLATLFAATRVAWLFPETVKQLIDLGVKPDMSPSRQTALESLLGYHVETPHSSLPDNMKSRVDATLWNQTVTNCLTTLQLLIEKGDNPTAAASKAIRAGHSVAATNLLDAGAHLTKDEAKTMLVEAKLKNRSYNETAYQEILGFLNTWSPKTDTDEQFQLPSFAIISRDSNITILHTATGGQGFNPVTVGYPQKISESSKIVVSACGPKVFIGNRTADGNGKEVEGFRINAAESSLQRFMSVYQSAENRISEDAKDIPMVVDNNGNLLFAARHPFEPDPKIKHRALFKLSSVDQTPEIIAEGTIRFVDQLYRLDDTIAFITAVPGASVSGTLYTIDASERRILRHLHWGGVRTETDVRHGRNWSGADPGSPQYVNVRFQPIQSIAAFGKGLAIGNSTDKGSQIIFTRVVDPVDAPDAKPILRNLPQNIRLNEKSGMAEINGELCFSATNERETGLYSMRLNGETTLIKNKIRIESITRHGGKLLFVGNETQRTSPYLSDGTENGTQSLFPEVQTSWKMYHEPGRMPVFHTSNHIAISDGTVEGSRIVVEFDWIEEDHFRWHGDFLYFFAKDKTGSDGKTGLWRTNGTPSGTRFVLPLPGTMRTRNIEDFAVFTGTEADSSAR